jgi:hypothetical protein
MKNKTFSKTFRILTLAVAASLLVGPTWVSAQTTGLSGSLEASRTQNFAKDPSRALMLAFFPGLIIHGYGHMYAKDKTIGTTLLAGEVISLALMGIGAAAQQNPESFQNSFLGSNVDRGARNMVIYGAILFTLTWIADVAHAPAAARDYNREHNLVPAFSMGPTGTPNLTVAYRF